MRWSRLCIERILLLTTFAKKEEFPVRARVKRSFSPFLADSLFAVIEPSAACQYHARAKTGCMFSSLSSFFLQENRSGYHTHQSRLGSRSDRSEKIESHRAEAGLDTVGGGSYGGRYDDEIPLGFALGVGFPPREHHSSCLAGRGGALPLQAAQQGLRGRQGKATYSQSFVGIFEYSLAARSPVFHS